jgi:quercetin dioxygenase-like cupin family protein
MTRPTERPPLRHLCALTLLLCACSQAKAEPPRAKLEPLLVEFKSLLASKPSLQSPTVSIWNIEQTSSIRVNLVEMRGKVRPHKHPDAAHSILIFEGSLRATVGDKTLVLNRGDFLSIPAGVQHHYETVGPSALVISCDAPYYDPQKTVYAADPLAAATQTK